MSVAMQRKTGKLANGTMELKSKIRSAMSQGAGHTTVKINDRIKHV